MSGLSFFASLIVLSLSEVTPKVINIGLGKGFNSQDFSAEKNVADLCAVYLGSLYQGGASWAATPEMLKDFVVHNAKATDFIFGSAIAFAPAMYSANSTSLSDGVPLPSSGGPLKALKRLPNAARSTVYCPPVDLYAHAKNASNFTSNADFVTQDLAWGYESSWSYIDNSTDWYHAPRKSYASGDHGTEFGDCGSWVEPYFDLGAGAINMTTYSACILSPIDGAWLGVCTIDIPLSDLCYVDCTPTCSYYEVLHIDAEGNASCASFLLSIVLLSLGGAIILLLVSALYLPLLPTFAIWRARREAQNGRAIPCLWRRLDVPTDLRQVTIRKLGERLLAEANRVASRTNGRFGKRCFLDQINQLCFDELCPLDTTERFDWIKRNIFSLGDAVTPSEALTNESIWSSVQQSVKRRQAKESQMFRELVAKMNEETTRDGHWLLEEMRSMTMEDGPLNELLPEGGSWLLNGYISPVLEADEVAKRTYDETVLPQLIHFNASQCFPHFRSELVRVLPGASFDSAMATSAKAVFPLTQISRGKVVPDTSVEGRFGNVLIKCSPETSIKKVPRMIMKVQEYRQESRGCWPYSQAIADSLRACILCENPHEIKNVWESVKREFKVVSVKNKFRDLHTNNLPSFRASSPVTTGHSDNDASKPPPNKCDGPGGDFMVTPPNIMVIILLRGKKVGNSFVEDTKMTDPDFSSLAELQITTKAVYAAVRAAHKLYKIVRAKTVHEVLAG